MMKRTIMSAALAVVLLPGIARAQSGVEGLRIHGYVSQAYGDATDHQLYGLPTSGTWDYRAMALQLRYTFSAQDNIVFQLNHRRIGARQLQETFDDVELEWAFYQRRQGPAEFRAGRMPLPRGLFNEVRNVGTLLPFYRASGTFYEDGFEVVDGALGSVSWMHDSGWGAKATAYVGEIPLRIQVTRADKLLLINDRFTKAWGTQVTLLTPWPGIRAMASTASGTRDGTARKNLEFSGEAAFENYFLRGEWASRDISTDQKKYMWYVQGGVHLGKGLWLNSQYEILDRIYLFTDEDFRATEDVGLGLLYKFNPGLVAKGEWHDFQGYGFDEFISPSGPPATTKYFLVSLSVAF